MKRRLRKKKRVGEFTELGFEVLADLRAGITDDDADAFVGRVLVTVEARRLGFGGGTRDGKFEGFITLLGRGSASEEDRRALAAFLDADAAIVRHEVGALQDAWNGGH